MLCVALLPVVCWVAHSGLGSGSCIVGRGYSRSKSSNYRSYPPCAHDFVMQGHVADASSSYHGRSQELLRQSWTVKLATFVSEHCMLLQHASIQPLLLHTWMSLMLHTCSLGAV